MKKLLVLTFAVAISCTAMAQVKFDAEGIKKKIEESNAGLNDAKKNTKSKFWLDRGETFFNAETGATNGLYRGQSQLEVTTLFGRPIAEPKSETISDITYEVLTYPNFDVYMQDGKVGAWKAKTVVDPQGLDKSFEAYKKAIEIDPKIKAKAVAGLNSVVNSLKEKGDVLFPLGMYSEAAKSFGEAYDFAKDPDVGKTDTLAAYYAGYIALLAEDFDVARKYLIESKNIGNEQKGEVYFFIYHSLKNQQGKEDEAETILLEGLNKFPNNVNIIESLIDFYTSRNESPENILPYVDKALEADPNNFNLYFSRGLICNKIGKFEDAVSAFEKAMQLNSKDFGSAYNLGVIFVMKGDSMLPDLDKIPYSEQELYNKTLKEINSYHRRAIVPLENAIAIDPNNINAVELLRSLYFRFRDDSEEMMNNYNKYNELFKQLKGE